MANTASGIKEAVKKDMNFKIPINPLLLFPSQTRLWFLNTLVFMQSLYIFNLQYITESATCGEKE